MNETLEMDIIRALAGGALIGISASLLWWMLGRIAGISGIVSGLFLPNEGDLGFSLMFLAGLIVGGVLLAAISPALFVNTHVVSPLAAIAAGALVGFGAKLAGGCTSGHGVCGISRMSLRSFVATVVFIALGAATVAFVRALGGVQ